MTPRLPDGHLSDSQQRSSGTDSSSYFINLHGLKIRLSLVATSVHCEICFMSLSVHFYQGFLSSRQQVASCLSTLSFVVEDEGATFLVLIMHSMTTSPLFPWRIKCIKPKIGGKGIKSCSSASVRILVK